MAYYNIILFLLFAFFCGSLCNSTFYYFAYGSNLTGKRLKINCKSAQFYDVATLEDYRLDFNKFSKLWNGAVATIVEDPGQQVVGALWVIDVKDMPNLDRQEGVADGFYFAKNVTIETEGKEKITARTYQETENPPEKLPSRDLPVNRRPSSTYLMVIIFGAYRSRLPSDYISFLVSFPSNGKLASDSFRKDLEYPFGPE